MGSKLSPGRLRIPAHVPAACVHDFDFVTAPAASADPQQAHIALHGTAPDVFFTPRNGGHWFATRAADVQSIMANPDVYSSANVLPQPPFPFPRLSLPPQDMDGADHVWHRLLLLKFLGPKEVRLLEPRIRALTVELIEAVMAKGGCEFVADVAVPLPVKTFMGMMHMDLARYAQFVKWANGILASRSTLQQLPHFLRMRAYLKSLIRKRKAAPGDDPISMLLASEVDGVRLTEERVLEMCSLLFLAGLDTVTNALTYITRHLAENPADQRRLRDHPDQIPGAVEEFMRRYAFVTVMRRVTRDTELNGAPLRAGDIVVASLAAASNDDRVVECPARFDLDRPSSPHVAFNTGPHICAGALLARIEMRVFLEEWLSRVPPFRQAEDQHIETRGGPVMALATLGLRW